MTGSNIPFVYLFGDVSACLGVWLVCSLQLEYLFLYLICYLFVCQYNVHVYLYVFSYVSTYLSACLTFYLFEYILINKNFTDFHNQGNTLFFLDVSDYSFFRNDNDKNEQ